VIILIKKISLKKGVYKKPIAETFNLSCKLIAKVYSRINVATGINLFRLLKLFP
jgi:hypothetical protein